ncbi:MAG: polyphosphate glucokinase [Actinomycetota bacterium]|nr:polyphosphate glucokinase [Actinomycetota bacterium]MDQ1475588.1 polyphosphate glucokinase [Actinomycetota bacterium]
MQTGAKTLVGVDVGGSGVKAAIVDLSNGQATGRIRVETPQPATPDAVAAAVAGLVAKLPSAGPIGCTLPGVVTEGVLRTAAHIDPSWVGVHASTVFARATDRACVVLNDADAAGFAEARFGAARSVRGVVVMVTIGTGVGTAVLNDGVLVANSELGHMFVDDHLADDWVSDATRVGEDLSWKRWTQRLDRYLTHLHEIMWPELIVIGGGMVKHADKFLDRVDPGCPVHVAQLGNLAGIVGAALAADEHVPAVPVVTIDRS